ncbi:Methionine--tRNA ligase [Anaerococcus prevotii]|uniref:Methionine--tRNA ligase n=1 Tax=Anaerococcus prevotii (strain ATCC 9321 / DSM 20548 / JCM 6508 / NCTC 11806 / PC1) TaxID=525919 RepID=C7REC0_ANAPD|nr:methionine--tRNA ligase [Anaerococcus prevotii]ACV29533.1 methionyl-tRNA synthetase [Anaerococcus prevotii DSM 20548]SUU95207.1 Methionine--tRNA ligase [Anaerococcus prevotii]
MTEKKAYYITTPIYYPNSNLHIGNTYTSVIADVLKRYKNLKGFDAYLTTGTDEHGQKIMRTALDAGTSPQKFVDIIAEETKELWKKLEIDYDTFIRSTEDQHEKDVAEIFTKLYEKGDIYKGEYKGYYCTPCETFWTESQLEDGHCPDCGREVEYQEEETYFFRLSKYTDRLKELFKEHPEFLEPQFRQKEMLNNFIDKGLSDLSVTRNSFDWGVDVPFDNEHVVYVWIDALSCYLSAIGYGDDKAKFERYWPAGVHLIGKDIVRFHTIIWPALLMALDLPLPEKVFAHGWILFDNDKMSKSKGNIMYPEPLVDLYGVDALKFYMLREFNFGSDGNFSARKYMERYNSDLVNDLGNLVSRTTSMIAKYNGGEVRKGTVSDSFDDELITLAEETYTKFNKLMDEFNFNAALEAVWTLIRRANKYVDETEPWILGRDEANKERLDRVLYNLAETIRIVAQLIEPVMKNTTATILEKIGTDNKGFESAGEFGLLEEGARVSKGANLFDRLDIDKELVKLHEANGALIEKRLNKNKKEDEESKEEYIDFEDFTKVDLVVGKILEAKEHPNADKLLVFKVDIGEDEPRTIVSGIKKWYAPEDLLGKNVIVVRNLAPRKMRGIESQGMLLAADFDDDLSLLSTLEDLKPGAKVS